MRIGSLYITKRGSQLIGFGILVLFFLITAVAVQSKNNSRIRSASSTNVELPVETPVSGEAQVITLQDFERTLTDKGRTAWHITGKKGLLYPGGKLLTIIDPNLTLSRKEDENIKLTALKADLHLTGPELQSAELFEKVVLISDQETELRTEYAIYDKVTGSVSCPKQVTVDKKGIHIEGQEMFADMEAQEFQFTQGVKTIIQPKKK